MKADLDIVKLTDEDMDFVTGGGTLWANGNNSSPVSAIGSDQSIMGGSGNDCIMISGAENTTIYGGGGTDSLICTGYANIVSTR